jgi:hypothetical protein
VKLEMEVNPSIQPPVQPIVQPPVQHIVRSCPEEFWFQADPYIAAYSKCFIQSIIIDYENTISVEAMEILLARYGIGFRDLPADKIVLDATANICTWNASFLGMFLRLSAIFQIITTRKIPKTWDESMVPQTTISFLEPFASSQHKATDVDIFLHCEIYDQMFFFFNNFVGRDNTGKLTCDWKPEHKINQLLADTLFPLLSEQIDFLKNLQ